jgi:hypothetical protein
MPSRCRIALCATLALAVSGATMAPPAVAGSGGGRLEGLLVGVDGRAASGYTLHLIDGDGRDVGRSRTSDEGIYSFPELPSGDYALGVESPDGRVAVVDAPPVRVGRSSLARRDVRLTQADAADRSAALKSNPSLGLWWAGLSPTARAWSVVGMAFFTVITISAFRRDDDSGEEIATPIEIP